jgi:hypothetical protein
MSTLKKLAFVLETNEKGRTRLSNIQLLNVTRKQLKASADQSNHSNKISPKAQQEPNKISIKNLNMDSYPGTINKGLGAKTSTCQLKHERSQQGNAGTRDSMHSLYGSKKPPCEQSNEQWLAGYDRNTEAPENTGRNQDL